MIKILKLGIEGNYFNIIKSTYQKPTANTTLNADSLRSFSARSGRRQGCHLLLLLFDLVLDGFEGFKTAVEEAIVHVVETARKLISTHYKTLTDKELMLMYEQRKQLLEMETTPGENAVNTTFVHLSF